jgi:hypothetical protein
LRQLGPDRSDLVVTNVPFGRKSSIKVIGEEGDVSGEAVQHIKSLLKINGRAAVIVPDNVRRAHPAAPAHGHLLRPRREGQCALL